MPNLFALNVLRALACAAACAAAVGSACAQAYPSKPIRLIISSSPGGGTDAIGRVMAEALAASFKQTVVPENKGAAAGIVASEALLHAPPDGYTLMVTQNGHTTNPAVHKKLPYDTFRDFTPITPVAHSGLVLIATAATGVKSVKDLIEFAARSPTQLSFASAETSTRLAIEQIRVASGLPINSVAYNGTSRAMTDLAAGHVNFAVTTIAATLPHKGTGRFSFLAVLAPERSSFLPDVPTLAEVGWPDCEAIGWWGIFGPAHMAPELVQTLNATIRAAVASPEVQRKLAILSVDPWVTEPKEFEAFIRREVTATTAVARRAGIEAE